MIDRLRFVFTYLTPLLASIALCLPLFGIGSEWVRNCGILSLAASIGFYTNFIAIKMLFRPHQKTAFGRQGVIARNQQQIAKQLGQSISQEFFNGHELAVYLRQHRIVESWVDMLFERLRNQWLTVDNMPILIARLETYVRRPCFQQSLQKWIASAQVDQVIIDALQNQDLGVRLTKLIDQEFSSNPQRIELVVDKVSYICAEYIPDIADFVYQEYEQYLANQGSLKRGIVNFFGWAEELNQEKLKEQLFRFISSYEFRDALAMVIAKAGKDLSRLAGSPEGQLWLKETVGKSQQQLASYLQQTVVPLLIDWVSNWLGRDSSQRLLSVYLDKYNRKARRWVHQYIGSEKFEQQLSIKLPQLLNELQIERYIEIKINQYKTQQLEDLIVRTAGEHLRLIEVLGGVLGGLTGLALINPLYFAGLLLVAITFLSLEWWIGSKLPR